LEIFLTVITGSLYFLLKYCWFLSFSKIISQWQTAGKNIRKR